jgi:hypothetical protein
MTWQTKLLSPIALNNGRTLSTLSEARSLILALPEGRRRSEQWQYALGLLSDTAASSSNRKRTFDQLCRALKADGLI